jgi:hypothetical protein
VTGTNSSFEFVNERVMFCVAAAAGNDESVTVTCARNEPAPEAVPEITPVDEIVRPGGKLLADHRYGGVPPAAERFALNALPGTAENVLLDVIVSSETYLYVTVKLAIPAALL